MGKAVSIDPDDLQEGSGSVPWDRKTRVKSACTKVMCFESKNVRSVAWDSDPDDYPEGVGIAPVLALTFLDEEGQELPEQYWSAGSTKRLVPSEDGVEASDEGTTLIPNPDLSKDEQEKIGITIKSPLGAMLLELPNAGYPQNRMKVAKGNLTEIFEGMSAEWTQVDGPKTSGKVKPLGVPTNIEMGEDKAKKASKKTEAAELDDDDQEKAIGLMVKLAKAAVKEHDEVSRADFAGMVTEQFEDDKKVSADMLAFMGEVLYKKTFTKALGKADLELDGETIKAE